jgi:uncharacterized cofD-like protein
MISLFMTQRKQRWGARLGAQIAHRIKWLTPGLGVKRWLALICLGILLFSLGLAILVLDAYQENPDAEWLRFLRSATLTSVHEPLRAIIFGFLGTALVLGGIYGLNRALLSPFRRQNRPMLNELAEHRRRERGPKIVTVGGGHGLSALLRGLKEYSYNITAVVTVADDGGSSGRLRKSQGILPPGDIRNCLAALSDEEALISKLFQYRFPADDENMEGHSFGNLFISALTEILGNFEQAVAESGRVLSVHGKVLPATLHDVRLVADMALPMGQNEVRIEGESHIPEFRGKINRVWLEPNNPSAYPQVIQALLAADVIVVGPGSLFTSILPNLLVPDLAEAMRSSRALKIYVCNIAIQPGETDGFSYQDHIRVISKHVGENLFDVALVNSNTAGPVEKGQQWVLSDETSVFPPPFWCDLRDEQLMAHHDPRKLAKIIINLYQEKTGPLVE